jgi:hypothetical protein
MTWRTFFLMRSLWRRRSVVCSPARGAVCPAAELMRRGERFAGRLLRVRELFEERPFRLEFLNPVAGSGETLNGSRLGLCILGGGSGDGSLLRFSPPF